MQTVTSSYLDGIRDERAILREWQAHGFTDIPALARSTLTRLDSLCRGFDARSPVGQYLRGSRDFWRNQVKKHG